MTVHMQPITTLIVVSLLLPSSRSIEPLYHAFGPLKDAFGDQFPHLELLSQRGLSKTPQQPSTGNVETGASFISRKEDVTSEESFGFMPSALVPGTDLPTSSPRPTLSKESHTTTSFNLDTFTFNRNNTRRVDDIFSVLSDVSIHHPPNAIEPKENLEDNQIPSRVESHPTNDFTKKILLAVKNVENVLSTMSFMKGLYQRKKQDLKPQNSNSSATAAAIDSVLDLFLDVPSLEGIRTAGLTATSEEEFLDHLSSVLLGAESRSSALTLDPVTVIALLTLAAYLIRAVYQIITVTGRSLDVSDGNMNLGSSDLPDAMVQLYKRLSNSTFDYSKDERVAREIKEELVNLGDMAAVIKLYRAGENTCVKEFLCQEAQYRPLKSLTPSDILVGGISYYYGKPGLSRYIDGALLSDRDATCTSRRNKGYLCSSHTLNDAISLKRIFSSAAGKVVELFTKYNKWL
ncbi:hypothetical protein SK128_009722 [Halocaridina rubra]|uniref:Uncharacterized protein n=1 Tax=Halocaridina rubra TaxID=373956 RepID=A0AAN8XNZ2_HALRR